MKWKKKWKILQLLWNILYKYGWYQQKTYKRNGTETIADNDRILWINQKHIEKELDHKYLREFTIKYLSDHRKHRYELVEEPMKQVNRTFMDEKLATKVIMDCRTISAHKLRSRLGLKQHDVNKTTISINENNEFIWRRKHVNVIQWFKL